MDLRHTPRLFMPLSLTSGANIGPDSEEAQHHLRHVLRLGVGDVVRVFNAQDGEFQAAVSFLSKKELILTVQERLRAPQDDGDLWLCCALIKKAPFDFMLEKGTELGISVLQPLITQRTQIRTLNADRAATIARESAQQSDRLSLPEVREPQKLQDFLAVFPEDRALIVCAEWGDAIPIAASLQSAEIRSYVKAALLTGPEGGFTSEELDSLRTRPNSFFVRLGPRILRAETAAIAALTCWQALRGDWVA